MQTDRTEKTWDLFINHEQDRFIGRTMNLFIKVKICAIMRGLKVILGLNSQIRLNALCVICRTGRRLTNVSVSGKGFGILSNFRIKKGKREWSFRKVMTESCHIYNEVE